MMHSLMLGVVAGTLTYFAMAATAPAQAQTVQAPTTTVGRAPPSTVGGIVARTIDLQPIPSRIEHGVVSIRNTGTTASAPSIATVVCHLPGQRGGCGPDLPDRVMAAYEDPAYPNAVVVQIPAIQPGHVYSHNLTFWNLIDWATGAYQFDFVADAGSTSNESNEANNTGSHVWNVP
jgi:hypothetical protein